MLYALSFLIIFPAYFTGACCAGFFFSAQEPHTTSKPEMECNDQMKCNESALQFQAPENIQQQKRPRKHSWNGCFLIHYMNVVNSVKNYTLKWWSPKQNFSQILKLQRTGISKPIWTLHLRAQHKKEMVVKKHMTTINNNSEKML